MVEMVSQREDIDIAVLVIYILLLPPSLFVAFRHGFFKSVGFLYLCLFCGIRIASSAMGIISQNNTSSQTDLVWAGVLGSVGISPLLLASFGLVSQINRNSVPRSNIRVLIAEVLHIPNILALVLAIVGGTRLESDSASKRSSGHKFSQAGIIIFLVVFVVYVGLCLLTTTAIHSVADRDKRMLYAVILALPFIFVRILYSMLAVFLTNQTTFALVNGSAIAQLCMATIEEMIVVLVYLGVGITAPVRKGKDPEKPTYTMQPTTA